MAKSTHSDIPPESVRGHDLVVCFGGPRHGAVYFDTHGQSSWAERTRLAVADSEDPDRGATLGYQRTEEKRPHPKWPSIQVRVLRWGADGA